MLPRDLRVLMMSSLLYNNFGIYYLPPSSGDRRASGYYSPLRRPYFGSIYHPRYPGYQRRWCLPPEPYPSSRHFHPEPYHEHSGANYAMNRDSDPLRRAEKT